MYFSRRRVCACPEVLCIKCNMTACIDLSKCRISWRSSTRSASWLDWSESLVDFISSRSGSTTMARHAHIVDTNVQMMPNTLPNITATCKKRGHKSSTQGAADVHVRQASGDSLRDNDVKQHATIRSRCSQRGSSVTERHLEAQLEFPSQGSFANSGSAARRLLTGWYVQAGRDPATSFATTATPASGKNARGAVETRPRKAGCNDRASLRSAALAAHGSQPQTTASRQKLLDTRALEMRADAGAARVSSCTGRASTTASMLSPCDTAR